MRNNAHVRQKSVHFSSVTNEWSTPQDFFDKLDREFHFTLDPCCTAENAKCAKFIDGRTRDGLSESWSGETVFMNPPYGRAIAAWIQKAYNEAESATVVCLVPSRTDTAYWHDYAMKGEIRFIRGRLKFGGQKNSAPFPSAIVIFRKRTA